MKTELIGMRSLAFEVLREDPRIQTTALMRKMVEKARAVGERGPNEDQFYQLMWDLIVSRVVDIHADGSGSGTWPWFHLTPFGKDVVERSEPTPWDPTGYLQFIETEAGELDETVTQYLREGLDCFRRGLYFAASVMFGAASEALVLALLDDIYGACADQKQREELGRLIDSPRLPRILEAIRESVDLESKTKRMSYQVHQGSLTHLLSLLEAIRVHRNEAVHPKFAKVSREKVFLTIMSIPTAITTIQRLRTWYRDHPATVT